MKALGLRAIVACAALTAGCCTHPRPPGAYYGPTATLDEVVSRVDANNQQIPSLWARADFDGTILDDKKSPHSFSARGVLLYRSPHELLIRANDDFGNLLFEIGATAENYWLKSAPQDTMWWGSMATADLAAPGAIPIRPDLVLDVLAVGTIPTNFAQLPYPVMRFDNADDAYIVDSLGSVPGRLLVEKELWFDRKTLSPRKVILFDAGGRETLRADLSEPKPLGDSPAVVCTRLELFFPGSGSALSFTLRDQETSHKGIPHEGSIHMPSPQDSGMKNVIQADR